MEDKTKWTIRSFSFDDASLEALRILMDRYQASASAVIRDLVKKDAGG